jgi:protein TonB
VPLPEPPPAAAASAAPPPEAHEAKEEESRLAQRLVDQEALAHAIKKQYVEGVQRTLNRNLRYPLAARLAGETGKAKVRFSVSPDGGVFAIALNRSSGHARLDTAALDAVRRSAPFPPSPFGETREFDIWLDFTADDAEKNAAEAPAGDASSG